MKLNFYCFCNLQHIILARKTTEQCLPGAFPFKDGLYDTLSQSSAKGSLSKDLYAPGHSVIPHSPESPQGSRSKIPDMLHPSR